MKRGIKNWVLVGALALGGVAQAETSPQKSESAATKKSDAAKGESGKVEQMSQKIGVEIPSDPKAFLERVHRSNQTEIQLAQLAKDRTQNKDVRAYADTIVKDHQQMDQQLMAQAKKMNLTLATQPQPMDDTERKLMDAQKGDMEKLQTLRGSAFDSAFLTTMLGSHDLTLSKLVLAQEQFKQDDMSSFLKDTQKKVSDHRDRAYKLLGDMKPKASS